MLHPTHTLTLLTPCCAGDLELSDLLHRLEQLLQCLVQGRLTPDQANHVMRISLSKFVTMLLKVRLNEASMEKVNVFFQSVMQATVTLLRTQDAWEMVECTARILTDSPNYYFYQPGVSVGQSPSCDVDSQSSGDGSCSDEAAQAGLRRRHRSPGCTPWPGSCCLPACSHEARRFSPRLGVSAPPPPRAQDDPNFVPHDPSDTSSSIIASLSHDEVSPFLLRNVEHFHQTGGFTAILERLGSTPRVSLNAMRSLLRPLTKVRSCRHNPPTPPPPPPPPSPARTLAGATRAPSRTFRCSTWSSAPCCTASQSASSRR